MAAAVAVPLSAIKQAGILPPSPLSYNAPRHGRSRGASTSKGKSTTRTRGHSLADERDAVVVQALLFVLRARTPESGDDSADDEARVVDQDGWESMEHVLRHSKIAGFGITLDEVQRVVESPAAKGRLVLRTTSEAEPEAPTSYQIRRVLKAAQLHQQTPTPAATLEDISAETTDLPEFIVFETSYPKYHLILSSNSIKRAGGQPFLSFVPAEEAASTSDVSIWVHLQTAMAAAPGIAWKRTETGGIVTADEVPSRLWKKAVARRGDLGVLFEDGVVRKEVPVGLRGKGAKAKKGKGVLKNKEEEGSGSASE